MIERADLLPHVDRQRGGVQAVVRESRRQGPRHYASGEIAQRRCLPSAECFAALGYVCGRANIYPASYSKFSMEVAVNAGAVQRISSPSHQDRLYRPCRRFLPDGGR